MDALPLERLIRIRRFPAVVHPRHARELLAGGEEALAEWTGGYAIIAPEHRQLLEDLLGALAWEKTGQAVLVNGIYGAGKSHLLVLLHLLAACPAAWAPFLEAHHGFKRYAQGFEKRRLLVVHFSLDEYGPGRRLEDVVDEQCARAMAEARLPVPETAGTRSETWANRLSACREGGLAGVLMCIDELSLFLASKSPTRREDDAAYLQFLAGWTARAPLWLVGALQCDLVATGALRTHSWRQVEDRFRRVTLSPQGIGRVLQEKLVQRLDPAAARALVSAEVIPAAEAHGLGLAAGELQAAWPFHPAAIELLMAVANAHLSPHRSAAEVLQRLDDPAWLARPANRLITPLDLFALTVDDLRRDERLARLWAAVDELAAWAEQGPELARDALRLLALLKLSEQPAAVAQMRALLFDGAEAPSVEALSAALHYLRRYGAYLAVVRDADPAAELFRLEIDDEPGALAAARMQELRREWLPRDPRVAELALEACDDPAWPLAAAPAGVKLAVEWCGVERSVLLSAVQTITAEKVARACEGVQAGQADARALLLLPGAEPALDPWHRTSASVPPECAGRLLLWLPRTPLPAEWELWAEYAAWLRAGAETASPAGTAAKRARTRCLERAAELKPAVVASMRQLYQEGRWLAADGNEGQQAERASCAETLGELLAPGFATAFPLLPELTAGGLPSRAALGQLLAYFVEPGECLPAAQSVLADYLERFAEPLGIAALDGGKMRLNPPRAEIMTPLLAEVAPGPVAFADALAVMHRPPLGLSTEQARLALFAAARSGAVQGLDGFLQPLDLESMPLSRSDAIAFLGPPEAASEADWPLVEALAAGWAIVSEPRALACSQVERRLRGWIREWAPRLPQMREAIAEWTVSLQAMPWGWQASERRLAVLARLAELAREPLAALLEILRAEGGQLPEIEPLWQACAWWKEHCVQAGMLDALCAVEATRDEAQALHEQLAAGESAISRLPEIGARLERLQAAYTQAYRAWHEAVFGELVVAGLRAAFAEPAFRAVKALCRLPLALPELAVRCLDALAAARANYCPGLFTGLEEAGTCAKCRQPLGSPSPMPAPDAVRQAADAALAEYAILLQTDPWAAEMRNLLPRAPAEIAARASLVLGWTSAHSASALADALDEPLIAWLCRDHTPAAKRRLRSLHDRLHGRDLTVGEAKVSLLEWLDPDGALGEDAVVAFE